MGRGEGRNGSNFFAEHALFSPKWGDSPARMEISPPLLAAALWALAATTVAFLPMRHQYVPGFSLLLAAPPLLAWITVAHGVIFAGLGVLAFVSMFRNPLRYFIARARGQHPEIPK